MQFLLLLLFSITLRIKSKFHYMDYKALHDQALLFHHPGFSIIPVFYLCFGDTDLYLFLRIYHLFYCLQSSQCAFLSSCNVLFPSRYPSTHVSSLILIHDLDIISYVISFMGQTSLKLVGEFRDSSM